MYFSSALIISLLFYHRVIFSDGSFLREKIFSDEDDILEKFFAETKLELQSRESWQVVVVAASNYQLDQAKTLLTDFPHFVGTDLEKYCGAAGPALYTLTIYFLASLEEGYLRKVGRSLVNCKKNYLFFIFDGNAPKTVNIELALSAVTEEIGGLPFFVHHRKKSLKLFGYGIRPDCSVKVELLSDWTPRASKTWMKDWRDEFTRRNCAISIGTKNHPPWMNLVKDTNGTTRIVGGLEGKIIETLAEKMNFTPLLQEFKVSNEVKGRRTLKVVSSCAAGNTSIGIAHIRPTADIVRVVDMSYPYNQECVVWCVPRITGWKRNIIVSEFSWYSWLLIGLTFIAGCVVEKINRNTHRPNRGIGTKSGWCEIILDFVGSTLGNPIIYRPLAIGGKVLLIVYLGYSTVITTAYKTSLSSMLTVDNLESSIVDVEGIIEANLTTGGDMYRLDILKEQMGENELIPELIKRYVIEPNISKALRQVSYEKNMAYLISLYELAYHNQLSVRAGEQLSFDVLEGCVLTHSNVVIFPKLSLFAEEIDRVIQGLAANGLLQNWPKNHSMGHKANHESTRFLETMNTQNKLHKFTRDKFYQIFYIYCLALAFCVLVFFGELLVHKFKFPGRA